MLLGNFDSRANTKTQQPSAVVCDLRDQTREESTAYPPPQVITIAYKLSNVPTAVHALVLLAALLFYHAYYNTPSSNNNKGDTMSVSLVDHQRERRQQKQMCDGDTYRRQKRMEEFRMHESARQHLVLSSR